MNRDLMPDYYSLKEVADILEIPREILMELVLKNDKSIPTATIVGNMILFHKKMVQKSINSFNTIPK